MFDNVLLVQEHTGGERASRRQAVLEAIGFVGLDAHAHQQVGTLGAAQRLVEVARAVVGTPRVVLLDEPAAGLPDDETEHLASVIKRIPSETGALVILVDHDMSLVSACCATAAVTRLRSAHRLGHHGRGAAQRARHPRLPGDGDRAVTEPSTTRPGLAGAVRRPDLARIEGLSVPRASAWC